MASSTVPEMVATQTTQPIGVSRRMPLIGLAFGITLALVTPCSAEEPAEAFVQTLRSAGFYDVALTYLDRMATSSVAPADFRSSTELEKAQVFFDLAKSSRDPGLRDEYLAKTESSLKTFIGAGDHPRIGEARMQLGSMQLIRASQLMSGEPTKDDRKTARAAYLSAADTFTSIVKKIRGELESMKGAKIDVKKDPEAASRRDRLRGEYLQGLVSSADARKMAAETFENPAKDGKKLLQAALVDFNELGEKYDDYVQGVIAYLYAGEIHEQLGQTTEAGNAYRRLLEVPDADDLRESKFRAISGLIRLAMSKSPPDLKTAIELGTPWVDKIRPNERTSAAASELQLNLAKALLAKSDDKKMGKPGELKQALSDGRKMLNKIVKIPGEHLAESKKLLEGLGVSVDDSDPLPVSAERPKNLADALNQSRMLLQASEELSRSLKAIKSKKGDAVEAQRSELETQLAETRGIASEILRMGLATINSETDGDNIRSARQFSAYTLLQSGRYRDAVVVGSFLSKSAPGTDAGLAGGLIAMNALRSLLLEDETNETLIGSLRGLGDYLSKTWPNDPSAAGAKSVLVQLALKNSNWDQALQMIGEMPGGGEKGALQRLLGRMMYADSVAASRTDDSARATELLSGSEKQLRAGLKSIQGGLVDENSVKAALTLAKIEIKGGGFQAALKTLNDKTFGPIPISQKLKLEDSGFKSDLYGTELRALVGNMTDGGDASASLERAVEVMDRLKGSVTGEDAQTQLSRIYMGMARDIRDQIDTATPDKRDALVEAFRVFLEKMSQSNNDPSTLQWIGQTLMTMAEATMPPGANKADGASAKLLETSVATFEQLKAQGGKLPASVDYQLGKAQRLSGQYQSAIDTLEVVLAESPMMLNAQMEAAMAYEQWAPTVDPPKFIGKAYSFALNGARPGGSKNQNVIWGWGKISKLTSSNPKFRQTFFESRYHVALCRYLQGKAEKNDRIIAQSATDITKVAALYPDLGGPPQHAKFDKLLRQIQSEMGTKVTGLPK